MFRDITSLFFAFFCLFILGLCAGDQSRVVKLNQGPIKGYKDPEYDIYTFYNIPYATAPTGPDRFKEPLPPPEWSEVFEAVDRGIFCPQYNYFPLTLDNSIMQEDCLIANVFVPETNENNLPVVVYVHGGAYVMGFGNLCTPKNLVNTKNVIVVTFNYRLGAHGFLCLGTKDIPGNAGMKDQVALLRWVKKNISKFGGNPDDITVAGYSAGSSSVDLLMISKTTDNLFGKVIPESGANTAAFSIQSDPIKNAKEYANLISTEEFKDIQALEKFYKTVSYEQLISVDVMNRTDFTFLMSPCVESDIGQEVFLIDSPVNILKSGIYKKLPMLYGFANMEGLFRMPLFDTWKHLMNEKFSDFLPGDLKFKDDSEKEQVADRIKRFYFGDKLINEETILSYIDYFSDVFFTYPTLRAVKLHVEAGNNQIYLYEYSYCSKDDAIVPFTNICGANHCAQSEAVLDGQWSANKMDEKDISHDLRQYKKIVREIWINFILTGKPVPEGSKLPEWLPVGEEWSPYMSLNRTLEMKGSLLKERTTFWESIYKDYYFEPLAPVPSLIHTEL